MLHTNFGSYPRNQRQLGLLRLQASDRRIEMTFGRGALLWLLGIPLPVILLLALFWR